MIYFILAYVVFFLVFSFSAIKSKSTSWRDCLVPWELYCLKIALTICVCFIFLFCLFELETLPSRQHSSRISFGSAKRALLDCFIFLKPKIRSLLRELINTYHSLDIIDIVNILSVIPLIEICIIALVTYFFRHLNKYWPLWLMYIIISLSSRC